MIKNILKIMRLNQSIKHVFILPGLIFGYYLTNFLPSFSQFFFAGIAVVLIASSNYIINEITDSNFDVFHDLKKDRVLASKKIEKSLAYFFYFFFSFAGILISYYCVNFFFSLINILFLISGIIYNIKPLRLKDIPIIDVLCASLNNPIRFLLGFSLIIDNPSIPSLSLLLSYWFAGSFLMNAKRLSEVHYFDSLKKKVELKKFRKVYNFYNIKNLDSLSLFYSSLSLVFLTIFIIKYKIEYIFLFPIIIFIFTWYHHLSIKEFSKMQEVSNLIYSKTLIISIIILIILFIILTFLNLNFLKIFLDKEIIQFFEK